MLWVFQQTVRAREQDTEVKIKHIEEFKQEAVQIAPTNGQPRERVAKDLGIGKTALGKWATAKRLSTE
jgi:transposase-like protein